MADAVKTEQSPEPTAAQKSIAKKLSTLMPGAKLFEPRAGGSYYGPVVGSDRNFILQQVGEGTVIAHPKSQLALEKGPKFTGQIVTIAHPRGQVIGAEQHRGTVEPADPSRWQEMQARTPASQEHVDIARAALGSKFSVYNAASADRGLSPAYTGVIAATTDEHLIQRINSQTAIVHHVGNDVAKQFGAGQEASIHYDNGLFKSANAIERPSGQEQGRATRSRSAEPTRTPDDKAKAASWALAKNITAKMHGPESKFYSARRLDAEKGKFRGAIVAVTDHHVIQRIGDSNKFVSHSREDVRGELQVGTFAQINYRDGQAQSVRVQRGQDRQQRPSQEHERRNQLPAPDPRRASPAQGMSR